MEEDGRGVFHAHEVEKIELCFKSAIKAAADERLLEPGAANMLFLLQSIFDAVTIEQVQEGMNICGQAEDHSPTYDEFFQLCVQLNSSGSKCKITRRAESESSGEDENEIEALVDAMAKRFADNEFPIIEPWEVVGKSAQVDAEDLKAFVRKTERLALRSFLDAHFQKHEIDNPDAEDFPTKTKHWNWAREHHYFLCRVFYVEQFLKTGSWSHRMEDGLFLPLFSAGSLLSEFEVEQAKTSLSVLQQSDIAVFDAKLMKICLE